MKVKNSVNFPVNYTYKNIKYIKYTYTSVSR